jgi:hypothetical protein
VPLFQNGKLLPKSQVFQKQVAARTAKSDKKIEQELQRTEHELVVAEASLISMQAYSTAAAKTRSICALFIGLRLLIMVLRCHPLTCILLKISLVDDSSEDYALDTERLFCHDGCVEA